MLTLPNHIDKADIDAFVAHVTSEVNEGIVDPLSVHIRCKAVIKALEARIVTGKQIGRAHV